MDFPRAISRFIMHVSIVTLIINLPSSGLIKENRAFIRLTIRHAAVNHIRLFFAWLTNGTRGTFQNFARDQWQNLISAFTFGLIVRSLALPRSSGILSTSGYITVSTLDETPSAWTPRSRITSLILSKFVNLLKSDRGSVDAVASAGTRKYIRATSGNLTERFRKLGEELDPAPRYNGNDTIFHLRRDVNRMKAAVESVDFASAFQRLWNKATNAASRLQDQGANVFYIWTRRILFPLYTSKLRNDVGRSSFELSNCSKKVRFSITIRKFDKILMLQYA
jgi:hypothetical protein